MDKRMVDYYEQELRHVRESAAEFARDFPKIASRLSLSATECQDPYVERLLEGFAFLSARVQLKLDSEFPRFTNHLLQSVYPHYLCPTPSMLIAQIHPDTDDSGLAAGFPVPRDTALRSQIGRHDQTACEYRTAHDISLWPIELVEAQYHTRDLGSLDLPRDTTAKAAIRIRLKATAGLTFAEIALDTLPIHLTGTGDIAMRLYEQIFAHCTDVIIRPTGRPPKWQRSIGARSLRRLGFSDSESLLPAGPRSFQGYRYIQEYFAFPERFMFAEVSGIRAAIQDAEQTQIELVFLMDEVDIRLESGIDADNFQLHCTPAINLFPKRADRIHVSDRFHEFHVIPDRTRPLDYEVYDVLSVSGFGSQSDSEQEFRPFYAASDHDTDELAHSAYFATSRVTRTLSAKERRLGRRSHYTGNDTYVSLVDAANAPYRSDLRQLGVTTRCTNRDLPMRMPIGTGKTDFTVDIGASIESVRCVGTPTVPRASAAEGETAWRLISHLTLNHLSLVDNNAGSGAQALRDLLSLYGDLTQPHFRKQIEGVRSIRCAPITRRVKTTGPITFARGLEVTLELEEMFFEGTGVFLLGAVLEQFFAKYVSINSFTETVIRTPGRGEVMRWPSRIGLRHTL